MTRRLAVTLPDSDLERAFDTRLIQLAPDLPPPEREYRFHARRKWRIDRAWPAVKVGVELEGGVFSGGRHTTGSGFTADCVKLNTATVAGWLILRFTTAMLEADPAGCIRQLEQLIRPRLPADPAAAAVATVIEVIE